MNVVKIWIENCFDRIHMLRSRQAELAKIRDPRRVRIHENVKLTKKQMDEIDRLYVGNYGKRIPYVWHKHFTAYTGKFDPAYIPEFLFIPEFERFMNADVHYVKAFEDKAVLPIVANSVGVEMPTTIFSVVDGMYRDAENKIITIDQAVELLCNEKKVFVKPTVGSSSGRNCKLLKISDGIDLNTGKQVVDVLREQGNNYIAQKCITCHKSISEVYPDSVNTFRIITYLWNGKIEHMPLIMRMGQGGSYLDNAHAGGMFIAVSDSGIMHEKAFTEFRDEFERHPTTGVVFAGHKIENVPQVIAAAERMHRAIPQIGCINWDFTVNESGTPVLIEGNMRYGSVWLIEMAHGCAAFGTNTPEILQWLRRCKKLPKSQRKLLVAEKNAKRN